ncbi:hypothetical protein [Streptomyces sp. P9-A2]|uniref:hypothetical protein n=1 Tax=Streptomyces sp. P9-A2 TaxID=3072284 RepID=UPI002FCA25F5
MAASAVPAAAEDAARGSLGLPRSRMTRRCSRGELTRQGAAAFRYGDTVLGHRGDSALSALLDFLRTLSSRN